MQSKKVNGSRPQMNAGRVNNRFPTVERPAQDRQLRLTQHTSHHHGHHGKPPERAR